MNESDTFLEDYAFQYSPYIFRFGVGTVVVTTAAWIGSCWLCFQDDNTGNLWTLIISFGIIYGLFGLVGIFLILGFFRNILIFKEDKIIQQGLLSTKYLEFIHVEKVIWKELFTFNAAHHSVKIYGIKKQWIEVDFMYYALEDIQLISQEIRLRISDMKQENWIKFNEWLQDQPDK